jgi:hypothetical protein
MGCAILVRLSPRYFRTAADLRSDAICRCFVDTVSQNLADFQSDVSMMFPPVSPFSRHSPSLAFFFFRSGSRWVPVPLFPVLWLCADHRSDDYSWSFPLASFCLAPGTGSFVPFRVAFFFRLFPPGAGGKPGLFVPRLARGGFIPQRP